jgi:hypothetical protein
MVAPALSDDDEKCIIHGAAREEGAAPANFRDV